MKHAHKPISEKNWYERNALKKVLHFLSQELYFQIHVLPLSLPKNKTSRNTKLLSNEIYSINDSAPMFKTGIPKMWPRD